MADITTTVGLSVAAQRCGIGTRELLDLVERGELAIYRDKKGLPVVAETDVARLANPPSTLS